MYILGLDTSSPYLSMAVSKDTKTLAERNCREFRSHSSHIAATLEELLKKQGLAIKDIRLFAVSIGPGSFTGLRIAAAFIKGLAFDSKTPIAAVPTLDVLAAMCGAREEYICPVVDAKRQNVYSAIYRIQKTMDKGQGARERIKKIAKYSVVPIGEMLEKLKAVTKEGGGRKIIFTGDGIGKYRQEITETLGKRAVFAGESKWYPMASVVARLGLKLYNKGKVTPLDRLKPMYLYPRDIQCQKRK